MATHTERVGVKGGRPGTEHAGGRPASVPAESRALALLVEYSDDAIIGKTADGVITSWNRGAERIYGYARSEILGKPIAVLLPPNRRDEFPELKERISRGEHVDHYETERRRKDGKVIDMPITLSPVRDEGGRITGFSSIGREITIQKQAAEYALIVESTDDAIIGKSADGIIRSWNRGAERIYGYTRDEIVGKSITTLLPPNRIDEFPELKERIAKGLRVEHYETERRRHSARRSSSGSTRSLRRSAAPSACAPRTISACSSCP